MKTHFDLIKSARSAAYASVETKAETPLEQDKLALAKFEESGEDPSDYQVWKQLFVAERRYIEQASKQFAPSAQRQASQPAKPASS